VFDEVSRICNISRERRADISEPFFYDFVRTCRKRGIGLVVATQTPGMLPPAILANLSTWYAFKPVDTTTARVVASSMGLSRDQMEYFVSLPPDQGRIAAVRHPAHPRPFLVQVADVDVEAVSQEVVNQAVERTKEWLGPVPVDGLQTELDMTTAQPPMPQTHVRQEQDDASTGLGSVPKPGAAAAMSGPQTLGEPTHPFQYPKRSLDYVEQIAQLPFEAVTERDGRLGMSAWMGNRVRQELCDAGLIRLHRVNIGGRGKLITLAEPTDRTYELLDALQVKVERPRGNGGFVHRFWQDAICRWAAKHGYPARIEQALDKKRVDVGVVWAEKRCAVEVVMVGLEKEIANVRQDLDEGWDQVVFAAESRDTLDRLEQMIREEYGDGLKQEGRVAFMRFREFVG